MHLIRIFFQWTVIPLLWLALSPLSSQAAVVDTNEVHSDDAPAWLKPTLVNKTVERIQYKLEWDIRKVRLYWHPNQAEFQKSHGYSDSVLAYSRLTDNSVHLGPQITETNFESVFGHELVHIILYQKYKGAVPKWLEEGMANYLSNHKPASSSKNAKPDPSLWTVNYTWLAEQPSVDVLSFQHPFKGSSVNGARYHYQASQALVEMIATHCDLDQLLQLSVGKKLQNYLGTFCGIKDVNAEFKKWIAQKAHTQS